MTAVSLSRRLCAEFAGTAWLVATVVGSGIMAAKLAGGNLALALLCNAVATGAILVVLIIIFGPLSGAHFNPVVSFVMAARSALPWHLLAPYILAQTLGGIFGAVLANAMFGLDVYQISTTVRDGKGQWISEFVAAFGLIGTILGCQRVRPDMTAVAVGLYITSAYWFTASTSFANPAVTIARTFSNTFAGIAPTSVTGFVIAQFLGALAGAGLFGWLFDQRRV